MTRLDPARSDSSTASSQAIHVTVRDLRRRWKPQKERLSQVCPEHPASIRFHRACSWLQRVEQLPPGHDDDLALLALWVGFNALYGRWDASSQQPYPDRDSYREFLTRICRRDVKGCLAEVLQQHKRLIMSILEDQYLSSYYWQDPTPARAGKSKKSMYEASTWYLERRWLMILERLLERIYLLRCQLVHGAATHGGKLNREPVRRCVTMLNHLLPCFLTVVIDEGADEDWGEMCYPPLRSQVRR